MLKDKGSTPKKIDIHREYSLNSINKSTRDNNPIKVKLIEIKPSQLSNHHHDRDGLLCKRIRKYKPDEERRYFSKNISMNKLEGALEKGNVNRKNYKICRHDSLIEYTYQGKPTIFLNIKNGKFYALEYTLSQNDRELIELQAYIVTEILKKSGYSNCKRGKSKQIYYA